MENLKPLWVLAAEDDPDDRLLVREAFAEANLPCQLDFVEDGNELLDYLLAQGNFVNNRGRRTCLIMHRETNAVGRFKFNRTWRCYAAPPLDRGRTQLWA